MARWISQGKLEEDFRVDFESYMGVTPQPPPMHHYNMLTKHLLISETDEARTKNCKVNPAYVLYFVNLSTIAKNKLETKLKKEQVKASD